ncbi:hypothetical protein N2152v2_010744 [Parachlorella kessleri]
MQPVGDQVGNGPGTSPRSGPVVKDVPDLATFVPAGSFRTSHQPILSAAAAASPGNGKLGSGASRVTEEVPPASPATPKAASPAAATTYPADAATTARQPPAAGVGLPTAVATERTAVQSRLARVSPPGLPVESTTEYSTTSRESWLGDGHAGGTPYGTVEVEEGEPQGVLGTVATVAASTAAAAWEATKNAVGGVTGGAANTPEVNVPIQPLDEEEAAEPGLLAKAAQVTANMASAAVETTKGAVAAVTGTTNQLHNEREAYEHAHIGGVHRDASYQQDSALVMNESALPDEEDEQQEPGLLAKAAQATADMASAAVETTKGAVAAVAGASTEEEDQFEDSREDGEILPGDRRHSSTAGPGLAPAGRSAGLDAVVTAKREALILGHPIPPDPTPPVVAGPKPVGFVPIAGAAVHAVGERPPVSVEKASAVDVEEPAAAGGRSGRRAAGAAVGGHSGAQTHGQDEDWISELVEKMWPYIRAASEKMAWEMLPDMLLQNKPSWIHGLTLKKFTLGAKEPDIRNISVFDDGNDIMDDVFIELEMVWQSKQDIEIEIKALPDDLSTWIPDFIDKTLSKLLTFTVGVEDLAVEAKLRLALRPLLNRVPVVGAVQIALVEQPKFSYEPTLGSGSAPLLPAIKSWIDTTIRDQIAAYVLPDHYFYQVDPEAEDLQKPVGVLLLEVVEARKVPRMDFLSGSDAFVEFYVRSTERNRTQTISARHPRWRESFEMPIHVPEHQKLTMVLWDYDPYSPNDEIGRCELDVSELQPGQTADMWLDVVSHSEEEQDRMKHDMRKRDRALRDVAKPFVHHSTKGTQLHVKATFLKFSDEEEHLIVRGHRQGMEALLASPDGQRIDRRLHNILLSGKLLVKVPRADNIDASSMFGRPSIKFVTWAGHGKAKDSKVKESTAVKLSKRGALEFPDEMLLDVPGEQRKDPQAAVVVELRDSGWFGGGSVGRVSFNLREVIQRRHIRGGFRLANGKGQVTVEIDWHPYF